MSAKKCICCNAPLGRGNRTKEHVIPVWLLEELELRKEEAFHATMDTVAGTINKPLIHVLDTFVQGWVCGDCNGGWMNALENEAKPMLIPLIRGERVVFDLKQHERFTISRWAIKTGAVLTHAITLRKPKGGDALRFLSENPSQVPPHTGVFLNLHNPTEKFSYCQKNHWINVAPESNAESSGTPPSASYKVALQLGHLVVLVAHAPIPLGYFLLAAGLHTPLWPQQQIYPSYWSGFAMPEPFTSHEFLERFSDALGVVHPAAHMI